MVLASLTGDVIVAVGALVGVAITAIVTYTETRRRLLDDLAHDYDLALRSNRVETYPALWALTEALPQYGKQRVVTISDLLNLIENLRGWYFERGGLFLSPHSRDTYFAFQTALTKATQGHEPYETIDPKTREQLRESGSSLRTALTKDIRSRERATLDEATQRA
jgi:hypothetical protein